MRSSSASSATSRRNATATWAVSQYLRQFIPMPSARSSACNFTVTVTAEESTEHLLLSRTIPFPIPDQCDVCLRTPYIGEKFYWKIGGRSQYTYSSPPALPVLQMAGMLKNSGLVRFRCLLIPARSYTW